MKNARRRKSGASDTSVRTPIHLFSDQPVPRGTTPNFEFEGLGRTLAELALNRANTTPFTAVIRGGWGRGKTTLMKYTEQLLVEPPEDLGGGSERRQVKTLWFNAWKYPDDDTVLAGLLGALLNEMRTGGSTDQLKELIAGNASRGAKVLLRMLGPVVSNALGFPLDLGVDPGPGRFDSVDEARAFHDEFRDLFGYLSYLHFSPGALVKSTKTGEGCWNEEASRKYVLAIFLDDLDRCKSERVIGVLEAINLFLDLPGVCFYLGLDWERLTRLLPDSFAESTDPFLEKIVQVSLELPQIVEQEAEAFLRQLIQGTPLGDELTEPRFEGAPSDVAVIADVMRGEKRHPRHLKRFLNDLSIGLAVLRNTGRLGNDEDREVPETAVVGWHLISEVVEAGEWRDLRADIANLKTFLRTWQATSRSPDRADELARAESMPDVDTADRRLTPAGDFVALHPYIQFMAGLSDDQLRCLVHLASPQVAESRQGTRVSPVDPANMLDPYSAAWVEVPAGTFMMGSKEAASESPPHEVTLTRSYRMSRHPITNADYHRYVQAVGARPPEHWDGDRIPDGKQKHPVVYVSWQDAVAYCVWLTKAIGRPEEFACGLPTEAEWEYAAAGAEGRRYPWGDEKPTAEHANYGDNIGSTSPVGRFTRGATPLGIHDLAGNVWEWCTDGPRDYGEESVKDPTGPEDSSARVLRGGAFIYPPDYLRCSDRLYDLPGYRDDYVGFRVVWRSPGGQEN